MTEDPYPWCLKNAESIFHVIPYCDFVTDMWNQNTKALDDAEKAFGIVDCQKEMPNTNLEHHQWKNSKLNLTNQ